MRRRAFQQSVLQLCRRIIDNQKKFTVDRIDLPTNGDFGFYDPEGILEWGIEYYLSNRNPGHLPRPGGMMGQTAAVRHDLQLLLTLFHWAQGEADADEDAAKQLEKFMGSQTDYNS